VFHPIPVGIQSQADDAEDENLPEVHPGAASGLLASENLRFQQREYLRLELRVHPHPLQTGENRRQFIAALARQPNLFDGGDL
jgi:hypothetical protein